MSDRIWLNAKEASAVLEASGYDGLGRHELLGANPSVVSLFFPESSLVLQLHSVRHITVEALRGPFWARGFIPPMGGAEYAEAGGCGTTMPTNPMGPQETGNSSQNATTMVATVPGRTLVTQGAREQAPLPFPKLQPIQTTVGSPDSSTEAGSPAYSKRPNTPVETSV